MNNPQQNNNSNLPLVIIGLVLIAALGGGWWLYSRPKAAPVKSNTNNSADKQAADNKAALELYAKAPAGAQPANTLGAATASVVVEEFADFQCPTCATVHPKMKEINSLYAGRIKFIYRNFPLTQIHKNAYEAAIASEAAGAQGKFWAMQDQLYTNQKEWASSTEARKLFEGYAAKVGLDTAKFQTDMTALPTKTRVDNDMARGQALKLTGTPSIFINGKELAIEQMEINTMRQFIDAELRKTSSGQTQPNQTAPQTLAANTALNQSASGSNVNK